MAGENKSRAELIAEMQATGKPDVARPPADEPDRGGPVALAALRAPLDGAPRFQYAVVNIGTFSNAERMHETLAIAGESGWELVTIYDKASNWVGGWEKGFMLLKRPVPEGVEPNSWCLMIRS